MVAARVALWAAGAAAAIPASVPQPWSSRTGSSEAVTATFRKRMISEILLSDEAPVLVTPALSAPSGTDRVTRRHASWSL
ncbi:hypothetical protein GCM10009630_17210 [Kribbella jejuensis]